MKKIVRELVFVFIANVTGASVWFIMGSHIYHDLHEIDLSLSFNGWINLLTHYALPIGILVTIFFYLELYIHKLIIRK